MRVGEAGVDEEVAPAGLGVGAHDGVLDLGELGEGLAVPLALADRLRAACPNVRVPSWKARSPSTNSRMGAESPS